MENNKIIQQKEEKGTSTSETFRLNTKTDKQIIEFLKKSNNKTGLIKDAISMYKSLVESGRYRSPFLLETETNWDAIFATVEPNLLLGRQPSQVKESVKEELREYKEIEREVKNKVVEPVEEECEEDYEEDCKDMYEEEDANDIV